MDIWGISSCNVLSDQIKANATYWSGKFLKIEIRLLFMHIVNDVVTSIMECSRLDWASNFIESTDVLIYD